MAQNSIETTLAFPARLAPEPEGGVTVTFRDLPEAITYGATTSDAETMAEEVLELAVAERMDRGEHIPSASLAQSGEVLVALRPLLAAKAALHCALARDGVTKSELARRLRVDEGVVLRMLHPRRASRIDNVASALDALGVALLVTTVSAKRTA